MRYEVIVGNIGTIYYGTDEDEAMRLFDDYVEISKSEDGSRAYGEDVTIIESGPTHSDIVKEHRGHLDLE